MGVATTGRPIRVRKYHHKAVRTYACPISTACVHQLLWVRLHGTTSLLPIWSNMVNPCRADLALGWRACRAAGGEASAAMVGLRRLYESGAVVPLPFLTSSQLPPAALLADAREGCYLPSLESLHLVRPPPIGR